MSRPEDAFCAIVLAGQRVGRVDALAQAHGVANKSLVEIDGAPLIRHGVDALAATPGLVRLRIVVEPERVDAIRASLRVPAEFVSAADNLADSVYAAAAGVT